MRILITVFKVLPILYATAGGLAVGHFDTAFGRVCGVILILDGWWMWKMWHERQPTFVPGNARREERRERGTPTARCRSSDAEAAHARRPAARERNLNAISTWLQPGLRQAL